MLEVQNNNVLIPIQIWEDLKSDFYFSELIETLEDRKELLDAQSENVEFIDFRNYDSERKRKESNV